MPYSQQQKEQLISLSNEFFGIKFNKHGNYSPNPQSFIELLRSETKAVKELCTDDETSKIMESKIPSVNKMIAYAKMRVDGTQLEEATTETEKIICRAAMAAAGGMSLFSVVDEWFVEVDEMAKENEENEEYREIADEIEEFLLIADEAPYEDIFLSLLRGAGEIVANGPAERFVDSVDGCNGGMFELCVDTMPSLFASEE